MPWYRKKNGNPYARVQRGGKRVQVSLLAPGETHEAHLSDEECERRYQALGAERIPLLLEDEARKAQPTGRDTSPAHLVAWYTEVYLAQRPAATQRQAKSRLGRWARWARAGGIRRLSDCDSLAAAEFVCALANEGLHPNTVAGYVRYLRAALNAWCEHSGLEPPVRKWPVSHHRQTPKKPLSREEVHALLRDIERHEPQFYPLILFLYRTALRIGDAVDLRWEQVDLRAGVIRLDQQKTGRTLRLPLDTDALHALDLARSQTSAFHCIAGVENPALKTRVFRGARGCQIYRQQVQRALRRASERLKMRVHAHQLRHTAAVELVADGTPITVVQRILGHASPTQTLEAYGAFAPGAEDQYIARRATINGESVAPPSKNVAPQS